MRSWARRSLETFLERFGIRWAVIYLDHPEFNLQKTLPRIKIGGDLPYS